jgi:hypothetical protein
MRKSDCAICAMRDGYVRPGQACGWYWVVGVAFQQYIGYRTTI